MKAYVPTQQAYRQVGGQHPAGCMLAYSLTTQPNGRVRFDGYKDDVMVISMSNLSPKEADNCVPPFMAEGNLLNPINKRKPK